MLGLLFSAFTLGARIVGESKERKDLEESKNKYVDKNGLTYTDHRGSTRLMSNDHLARYTSAHGSYYGNYILVDIEKNEVICNFSYNKLFSEINKLKNESKSKNLSTIWVNEVLKSYYNSSNLNKKIKTMFKGELYQDVITDAIYVIRKFNNIYYYVDISNGHIIRKTDYSMNQNYRIDDNDFISKFNQDQDQKICYYNFRPYYCSITHN